MDRAICTTAPLFLAKHACLLGVLLPTILGCEPMQPRPTMGDRVPELAASGSGLRHHGDVVGTHLVSWPLAAPELATRVGFMAAVLAPTDLDGLLLEARGVRGGRVGQWFPAEVTWQQFPWVVARVELAMVADEVQWRMPVAQMSRYEELTWSAVVPEPQRPAPPINAGEPLVSGLASYLAAIGVNNRAAWDAAATKCTAADASKNLMAIHHTAGNAVSAGGSYSGRVKAIQTFHMDTRGWCDIGYHFLISVDGAAWEGRPIGLRGAHVGGHNVGNIGISYIGCFQPGDYCESLNSPLVPPEAMIDTGGGLVGALASNYGITINATNIKGHRDHDGASTSCPGNNLYPRLEDIRSIASGGSNETTPLTGTVRGVLYNLSVTSGPSDPGNERIGLGNVDCDCGETEISRENDGFWEFKLAPGTYTLTASAAGFAAATRQVQITADTISWASIGLTPEEAGALLTVVVHDDGDGPQARLEHAFVSFNSAAPIVTGTDGQAEATLPAGMVSINVEREGYVPQVQQTELQAGAPKTVFVPLAVVVGVDPEEDDGGHVIDDDHDPDNDNDDDDPGLQVESPSPPKGAANAGCSCDAGAGGAAFPWAMVIVYLMHVGRRRRCSPGL